MDTKTFADYVQLFFQYGPFAILPFLMIFALPRLYKKLRTASKDLKPILKRNIWIYQVLIILLIVFCVGFWLSYFSGPKFYFGDVVDLPTTQYALRSPDLHLKTVITGGESTIQWIWQKGQGQEDAKLCFIRGNASSAEKSFYLYADALKGGRCRLIYNRDDGYLYYRGNPLPTKRKTTALHLNRDVGFGLMTLYAQERIDIEKIIVQLQSIDFDIRSQAVERVLSLSDSDEDAVNAIVHRGFNILKSTRERPDSPYRPPTHELLLSSMLTIANGLIHGPWVEYEHWFEILGESGMDIIIESAGFDDLQLQTQALEFLTRFGDRVFQHAEPRMQSEEYRHNHDYVRGVLNLSSRLPDKKEYLQHLQQEPWIQSNERYRNTVELNVRQMEMPRPDGITPKLARVIDLAWELKERNVRYKWGGKNEDEGFDPAGFIAYILIRAEVEQALVVKDPELWRASEIRSHVGERRPGNWPEEVGDIIFYLDGFVMLFLGENQIIGMTERGIMVGDYREFRDLPLHVNKINYE
jgi:hypothetical protein